MTPFRIQLQPFNQKLTVSLGGATYLLNVVYNGANGTWIMDIADQNGNDIATGIPLTTGADLIGQFEYLGIGGPGGQMVAQSSFSSDVPPTYSDLGTTGNLFFVLPAL